jgi:hypothetical protein
MPMPQFLGTNGDYLGGIRARLLADSNINNYVGRNRVRPYWVPGSDPTNQQDVAVTDDGYPFIRLEIVSGKSHQESDGMNFEQVIVQVGVFGEGYFPTYYLAKMVNGALARKKVDNLLNQPVYLLLVSGIVPVAQPERGSLGKDVFMVPLRYNVLNYEAQSVFPF